MCFLVLEIWSWFMTWSEKLLVVRLYIPDTFLQLRGHFIIPGTYIMLHDFCIRWIQVDTAVCMS